ncbi:S9 family peptidase [Qipengyuania sp. YG27]|uniref:S9 family peptidase n=1 Tax=Qipengyuania mesophila TaxID=2867246 RepID=A0ABS7JU82_9SPHN|nr:S9 family peptidase [Qipengyuania mesophila]MBX7501220.1 S9 family peptidase [Qipengyuania mesophila]
MKYAACFALGLAFAAPAMAQDAPDPAFTARDLFGLTVAADPQISPDGKRIAYVRRTNDIMTDAAVSSIWMIDVASGAETPLVTGEGSHNSPRWSPGGDRLAYVSTQGGGGPQLHVRWMASGQSANITALPDAPQSLAWSPDGTRIAYSADVAGEGTTLGTPLTPPEGAEWKPGPKVIDRVTYRYDGAGYLKPGFTQIFIVDAVGGAPRQLTFGDRNNGGDLEWTPDGRSILISGNRDEDWELSALDSEIYAIDLASGAITELTNRDGPDFGAQVSPDGRTIAYLGFDDTAMAYRQNELYLMDRDGTNKRRIAQGLDRDITALEWTDAGLFAGYEEAGLYKVAKVATSGSVSPLAAELVDTYYTRPYAGGQWSVSDGGVLAYTSGSTSRPSDVSVLRGGRATRLTRLNDLKLAGKRLAQVRELRVTAPDGTRIPSWIVLPADWREGAPLPMILEIHGGPYSSYGPSFSTDYQIYASAGYATLYTNPGGSTGYGQAFADRIEGNYPISNHDELMAAVDAAVAAGYADPDNLFVTGGSGGGILTAWVVGKTNRFAAAAAYKPVINWTSMALMSDGYAFFGKYWMKGQPWERPEDYWRRSPLVNAANITTPTLLLVGEEDYRTPRSEAEQFYGALKVLGVDTALVVTPGASHSDLTMSPSQQAAKGAAVLAWFAKYRSE